jgi:hypothetical protein
MKNLLAPAAIALAIGSGSVPATAHVFEEVTYRDTNNTIIISTKKENAASETLAAIGGQADKRLKEAVVLFCEGGRGSRLSDVLSIFLVTTNGSASPSVSIQLLSDPPASTAVPCEAQSAGPTPKPKPPSKGYFVDESKCHGSCEVGQFFGLDDDAVTVLSK